MGTRDCAGRCVTSCVAALLLATAQLAAADGAGSYADRSSSSDRPEKSQEDRAVDAYNQGYRLVEHAQEFAAQSSTQGDKGWSASQKTYGKALKKFNEAVKLDPSMHDAFTYIGYCNRKLGRYPDSLAAYERALKLKPNNALAIEYQGEAFLGLNRVEDARNNYLRLYALDRKEAYVLLRAMKVWADENAAQPPATVDVAALQAWVTERESAHDVQDLKAGW